MLSLETHLGVTASPQAPFPTDYVTLPVSAGHRRFGSLPLAAEEGHAPVLQCQLHRVLHSKHAQAASPPSGRATLAGRTVGHIPAPNLARRRGDLRGPRPDDLGGLGSTRCSVWPCSRSTRAKLDSLAMYTPSSASMGTMRAGGISAKRASLATLNSVARSAGLKAWAGVGRTASGLRSPDVRPSPDLGYAYFP